MTKQLLNKKTSTWINEVYLACLQKCSPAQKTEHPNQYWEEERLKVGPCFVAHVFFSMKHRWVIQLRGRRLGPSRLCKWSAIWAIWNDHHHRWQQVFFFYLPPKIMVHGMNEQIFRGEKKPFLLSLSFSFPSNFHKTSKNRSRAPNICWDPPCQLSPWMVLMLGSVGICWETDSKPSWAQRTLPHAE